MQGNGIQQHGVMESLNKYVDLKWIRKRKQLTCSFQTFLFTSLARTHFGKFSMSAGEGWMTFCVPGYSVKGTRPRGVTWWTGERTCCIMNTLQSMKWKVLYLKQLRMYMFIIILKQIRMGLTHIFFSCFNFEVFSVLNSEPAFLIGTGSAIQLVWCSLLHNTLLKHKKIHPKSIDWP